MGRLFLGLPGAGTVASKEFDPYYLWLGIPPDEQPPDHYRLLGIRCFEENPDVIDNAADQRMAHLRSRQIGQHQQASQRLLREISDARLTLLDPTRKANYDGHLRAMREQETVLAPPVADSAAPPPSDSALASGAATLQAAGSTQRPLPRAKRLPTDEPAASSVGPAAAAKPEEQDASEVPASFPWAIVLGILAGVFALAGVAVVGVVLLVLYFFGPTEPELASADPAAQTQPAHGDVPYPSDIGSPKTGGPRVPVVPPPIVDGEDNDGGDNNSGTVDDQDAQTARDDSPPADDDADDDHLIDDGSDDDEADDDDGTQVAGENSSTSDDDETANDGPRKIPMPSSAEQRELLARLERIYPPDELRDDERVPLARDFLRMGRDQDAEPAERFVLFRRAAELATDAGDAGLMSQVVRRMEDDFEIDAVAVEGALLVKMASTVDGRDATDFAEHVRDFADSAAADHHYEVAGRVLTAASQLPKIPAFVRQSIDEELEALKVSHIRYQAVEDARRALTANAGDADAHTVLAHWYCFEQDDWERGLVHLTQGSDAVLAAVAERELAGRPGTQQERIALGDAWWDAADSAEEPIKTQLLRRAWHWYRQIRISGLSGLDKLRLQARTEQLEARFERSEVAVSATPKPEVDDRFTALFEKGLAAARDKSYGDADRYFGHCIRMEPEHAGAVNNYALAALRMGQSQKAVRQWQRLVERDADCPVVAHNLYRALDLVDDDEIPLDRGTRRELDALLQAARRSSRLGSYSRSVGWLYCGTDGRKSFEDQACMLCDGRGKVDCPVRGCSNGKVRVPKTSVVGRNPITGAAITQTTQVPVSCRTCFGRGTQECTECYRGIDRRLR